MRERESERENIEKRERLYIRAAAVIQKKCREIGTFIRSLNVVRFVVYLKKQHVDYIQIIDLSLSLSLSRC